MVSFDEQNLTFPFSSLRIIPYQTFSGAFNMALDHVLAERMRPDDHPVLRFYGWNPYAVSIGRHQKKEDLDLKAVKKAGFEAVRRPTGGSAIFHSEELTYAFIAPRKNLDHHQLYELIHVYFAKALQNLGYAVVLQQEKLNDNYLKKGTSTFACFNRAAQSELQFEGRKILGSAQKLYPESVLQHGSLLIGKMQNNIVHFLKREKREQEKIRRYLEEHSASLQDIKKEKINSLKLSEAFVQMFSKHLSGVLFYRYPSTDETEQAHKMENSFSLT